MKKYLTKGSQIAIDGRIQTGSYDGADGKKVYTTDVIIENFQFLDSKASRNLEGTSDTTLNSNDNTTPYNFPSEEDNSSSENDGTDPFADFGAKIEVSDSELPF